MCRNIVLTPMRSRFMNPFIEGYRCPAQGFDCHCARNIRDARQSLSTIQGESSHSGHRLRSVQEGEPLLYL